MGVVHRARDVTLGRVVALKTLSAEVGGEDELQRRFLREAEAVGRLNHPSIVTVYDAGRAEGQLYLAMELLEGDDLRALIDRRAEIPLADRVRIMLQICEGLGYAHAKGVIHRDVKPANIFVTPVGRVKLLDFGLARVATRATITKRGVILGTPDYMSPEQAMGKPIDRRTDIFSAGSVFYEFLAGEKPFKGKTLHAVLYQIISESPHPLLTLIPELPARLAAVVHRMLIKDPDARYQEVDEVVRELQPIHDALRRSRSRSALPGIPPLPAEDVRGRIRDHLTRGRAHFESGRHPACVSEMVDALALDPAAEEAADVLWRALRARDRPSISPPLDAARDARIDALLAAASAPAEGEAQKALAELALIAPDDHRVQDLMRERHRPED